MVAIRNVKGLVPSILVGLYLVLAYGPLAFLLFAALPGRTSMAGLSPAPLPISLRQVELLLSSGAYAMVVAGTCAFLGLLAALFLWQRNGLLWKSLIWLLVFCIPFSGTIHSLAWISSYQSLRDLSPALPSFLSSGWWGSWFLQSMVYLPLSTVLCLIGLSLMETDLIRAGKVFRRDITVFSSIMLPLLTGLLATVAFLAGIFSLAEYTIPSLFFLNVYALEIFARYSATYRVSDAVLVALPLILLILGAVIASQHFLRSALQNITVREETAVPFFLWPGWFRALQWIGAVAVFGNIAVLLYGLVPLLLTGDLVAQWSGAAQDILYTLGIGLGATVIGVPLGMGTAWFLDGQERFQWAIWALVLVPMALPAPVIGLSVNHLLYGSAIVPGHLGFLLPVMVSVIRFTPIAAVVLLGFVRLVHPSLFDAGAVFSASRVQAWCAVYLPLLQPGILAGAALVFAFTMGELGATLLVVPPGMSTLTIRMFNYLHYGATDYVAGLAGAFLVLFAASGILLYLVLRTIARMAVNG